LWSDQSSLLQKNARLVSVSTKIVQARAGMKAKAILASMNARWGTRIPTPCGTGIFMPEMWKLGAFLSNDAVLQLDALNSELRAGVANMGDEVRAI
jgi:hypothetical protein